MRVRSRFGGPPRRAAVLAVLLVTGVLVLAAAQAPAQVSLQTSICGVANGSTWTRAGRTGRDWLVVALDDKSQCKSARQWLQQLGSRMTARSGADVQAFRLLGDACVLTKPTLLAACRTRNGGPGSVGVAVIGDPARNPAASPYSGGRTSFPALPAAPSPIHGPGPSADGVPIPWPPSSGGTNCNLLTMATGTGWSFRLTDGKLISGTVWNVRGSYAGSVAACQALRSQIPKLTAALGTARAATNSVEAVSWIDGSWACVASHDIAWPGGGNFISSIPIGACARVSYPGSGDHGVLEQVGVFPRVESSTVPVTRDEQIDAYERAGNVSRALDRSGIHAAAAAASVAVRLTGLPPDGRPSTGSHPWRDKPVTVCSPTPSAADPSYQVLGSNWTHGNEHGSRWQVAVNGGYPCELARVLFLPWLAGVLSSTSVTPAAQMSRYGWTCAVQRTPVIATCHFTGTGEPLASAVSRPIPGNMTIGIRAFWLQGASRLTLPNAVRAAS